MHKDRQIDRSKWISSIYLWSPLPWTHSCAQTTLTPIQTGTWTTHTIRFLLLNFPTFKNENRTIVRLQSEKAKAAFTYKICHLNICLFFSARNPTNVTCVLHMPPTLNTGALTQSPHAEALSPVTVISGPLSLRGVFEIISLSKEAFIHPMLQPHLQMSSLNSLANLATID